MNVQQLAIHRINIEKFALDLGGDFEDVPSKIIDTIIKDKEYQEHKISDRELIGTDQEQLRSRHGFTIRVFFNRKETSNKFSNFLITDGGNKTDFTTHVIHFVTFFFRTVKKRTTEKIQQVWEMFALTTHDGWRIVKNHSDFSFPLKIAKRIVAPELTSTNVKPLAGPSEATRDLYKKKMSLQAHSEETMWTLFQRFASHLKKNSSAMQLEAFKTERDKDGVIKIIFGPGQITIGKDLPLKIYSEILCHFSKIARGKETKIKNEKGDTEIEKDDPAFSYLEHIQRVDLNAHNELNTEFEDLLWKMFRTSKIESDFYFASRFHQDYHDSNKFTLSFSDQQTLWSYPPTLESILNELKLFYGTEALENKSIFLNRLKETSFKFNVGGKQALPIIDFFQGEFHSKRHTFFRVDGFWYQVTADHLATIQHDFRDLLSKSLMEKVNPGARLELPWYNSEASVTFTLEEASKISLIAAEVLSDLEKRIFSFIDPSNNQVLYPFITRCIFDTSMENARSYISTVKKKWAELNAFLEKNLGKNITVTDLDKVLFDKTDPNKPGSYSITLFNALKKPRAVCEAIEVTQRTGTILNDKNYPMHTDLSGFKWGKSALFKNEIESLSGFLKRIQEEDPSSKDPKQVTIEKLTKFISGLKKDDGTLKFSKETAGNRAQTAYKAFKASKDLPVSLIKKERFIIKGPIPKEVIKDSNLSTYLESKLKEYQHFFDEEGYNRLYLDKKDYFVADQVYADKIETKYEMFDLLRDFEGRTYLYAVKKEFGPSTREATAQLRTTAKLFHGSRSTDGFNHIKQLYDRATKPKEGASLFQQNVAKNFSRISEDAFINLFQRNKEDIIFVYAFALKNLTGRKLIYELEPPYVFSDKDFDNKKIIETLKKEKFLSEENRIAPDFFKQTASTFHAAIGGDQKESKKIYKTLMRKASHFKSIGAKVEILQLASFLRSCSFGFQICQIDQKSENSPTNESTEQDHTNSDSESSDSNGINNTNRKRKLSTSDDETYPPLEKKIKIISSDHSFKGFENLDSNCWLNASLQMLFFFLKEPFDIFFQDLKEIIELDQASFDSALKNKTSKTLKHIKTNHEILDEINCHLPNKLNLNELKEKLDRGELFSSLAPSTTLNLQEGVKKYFEKFMPLKTAYNNYSNSQIDKLKGDSIQSVRILINTLSKDIIQKEQFIQEDAHEGFMALTQPLIDGELINFEVERIEHREFINETIFDENKIPSRVHSSEPIPVIDLPEQGHSATLSQLFTQRKFAPNEGTLVETCIYDIENKAHVIATEIFYKALPDAFFCLIKRFKDHKNKNSMCLTLDTVSLYSECLEIEKTYTVDGIIVHKGPSIDNGHYYAYIKKNQKWYKLDDDKPVSVYEEQKVLQDSSDKAYILHLSAI